MEENAKYLAGLLRVLANTNRLLILCALVKSPLSVSEIAEHVPNISQPALSQHLQLLKSIDAVAAKKSSRSVIYSIADKRILNLFEVLRENYCNIKQ